MTRIKICGMTSLEDATQAADLGAWAIGLIHHRDSPRYVEPELAEEIGAALKRRCEVAGRVRQLPDGGGRPTRPSASS